MPRLPPVLAGNATIDQANSDGSTPLLLACANGHGDCTQLLLTANAVVQASSNSSTSLTSASIECHGETPLTAACYEGHNECARLLLAADAA
eukprot:2508528-Prymnesium_polylepis.1